VLAPFSACLQWTQVSERLGELRRGAVAPQTSELIPAACPPVFGFLTSTFELLSCSPLPKLSLPSTTNQQLSSPSLPTAGPKPTIYPSPPRATGHANGMR